MVGRLRKKVKDMKIRIRLDRWVEDNYGEQGFRLFQIGEKRWRLDRRRTNDYGYYKLAEFVCRGDARQFVELVVRAELEQLDYQKFLVSQAQQELELQQWKIEREQLELARRAARLGLEVA